MRRFAAFGIGVARALLGLFVLAFVFAASGPAARSPANSGSFRLLYAGDWSGTSQIYAVDPATGRRGQLTFGRAPACVPANPCGYIDPIPSPDGRRLLFGDQAIQGPRRSSLFVARADGSDRRRLAGFGTAFGTWSRDSRRVAYGASDGIRVANGDGSGDRLVDRGAGSDLAWSPDSRSLAFVRSTAAAEKLVVIRGAVEHVVGGSLSAPLRLAWSPTSRWLAYSFPPYSSPPYSSSSPGELDVVRPDGSGRRLISTGDSYFAWSPDGRWLAYSSPTSNELDLVQPDGSGRRRLFDSLVGGLGWSADGRSLAFCCHDGLVVADVATGSLHPVPSAGESFFSWSPRGHLLAYAGTGGIRVYSGRTSRLVSSDTTFGVTWSPDGRSLAYRTSGESSPPGSDLRVATLSGRVRTLVAAGGAYGGVILGFTWTPKPVGVRYRKPARRTLATVSRDELTAPWPIESLASDGQRVAYVACGHVFVWTPSTRAVVQAEPVASMAPNCQEANYHASYSVYSLALASGRVAFGAVQGNQIHSWWLGGTVLGRRPSVFELGHGYATLGSPYNTGPVIGELAGAGDLLVFGSWIEQVLGGQFGPVVTTSENVERAGPGGCPCPTIASSPGPLASLDVDGGRIVAGGDNATWLLDSNGSWLLTLPVSPLAAQLSGSDLVVFVRGELRDYDAGSGALRHVWPLPDVASGRECATPNLDRCNSPTALVLEDAARGLVTYLLDGQVHLLRLADGADTTVAAGTRARFMGAGLVYADGASLQLIPFARLPLR